LILGLFGDKKMEKKFGKNKAGGITNHNWVIMIVSLLVVSLFIGITIQPVMARSLPNNSEVPTVEEECVPCEAAERAIGDPKCETCVEAVFHAVKYMKDHVKNALKDKGAYFLWTADATILIFQGLILGIKDSGFKIKIDYNELNNTINFWVSKLWGPQIFFITRFMAKLGAVSIGITWYLLSFCIDTTKLTPN